MSVNLKINACGECPHVRNDRYYTADSFEYVTKVWCAKTDRPAGPSTDREPSVEGSSTIAVRDTFDKAPLIPEWCPLREDT